VAVVADGCKIGEAMVVSRVDVVYIGGSRTAEIATALVSLHHYKSSSVPVTWKPGLTSATYPDSLVVLAYSLGNGFILATR
jgi:hypothetical protein